MPAALLTLAGAPIQQDPEKLSGHPIPTWKKKMWDRLWLMPHGAQKRLKRR
jgi:hypothetical protein